MCPETGRARLSYRRPEETFEECTRLIPPSPKGIKDLDSWILHRLRHSDISGDPDDRTFCGNPTLDMERVNYQPAGPSAPRLAPNMKDWECRDCADPLRSL
ncbi:hypothetical protein [Streptomyces sp. NPDC086182]|uniref:hypothetical protein n=1 Tax=Streptomyces sp. NPDC086182 TaxID=3155058 RepID=UPI0034374D7E